MVMHFDNGDKYEGQIKEKKFHGKGKYEYANRDYYEGEYENDK